MTLKKKAFYLSYFLVQKKQFIRELNGLKVIFRNLCDKRKGSFKAWHYLYNGYSCVWSFPTNQEQMDAAIEIRNREEATIIRPQSIGGNSSSENG